MSRLIAPVACIAMCVPARAFADDTIDRPDREELGERSIGARIGLAGGGRVTPGGLRVAGSYTQRLDEGWWFEGGAAFTFGSGSAACFRDRMDSFQCTHRFADGDGVELAAGIRRLFPAQGKFRPYARGGIGVGVAHFPGDSVTGVAIPLHLAGGVRAQVAEGVAVVGEADLGAGVGVFGHGLAAQPILGFAIVAGAEFRLR